MEKLTYFYLKIMIHFPIMFINGSGSEIMTRIAAPMIGGMISATALTLVVIPVVYFVWKQHGLKEEY